MAIYKVIGIALAPALATVSVPALAQNSQTTCNRIGMSVICDTQSRPGLDPSIPLQVRSANPARRIEEALEASTNMQRTEQEQAAASETREVWAKCRKRWNEALEARDFELADSLVKGCPAAP